MLVAKKCGLVQLKDVPNELNIFDFAKSKYRIEYKNQNRTSPKHIYRAGVQAISRLKKIAPFITENTNDVIFLVCRKAIGKMFKRPYDRDSKAVRLAESRLKRKRIPEYIMNGGLLKGFKKILAAFQERYFSYGKQPKRVLDLLLMRYNQL